MAEDLQQDVHWNFCHELKTSPLSFHLLGVCPGLSTATVGNLLLLSGRLCKRSCSSFQRRKCRICNRKGELVRGHSNCTTVQDEGSMRTRLCMRTAEALACLPCGFNTYIITLAAARLNSLMIEQERNFLGKKTDSNK